MEIQLTDGDKIEITDQSTASDIQSAMFSLQAEIDKLSLVLDQPKRNRQTYEKVRYSNWYLTTEYAVKSYRRIIQELMEQKRVVIEHEKIEQHKRNQEGNRRQRETFESHFFSVAREVLNGKLFDSICAEANIRADGKVQA